MVNDPVTFNRCHKLVNRIRFYHKVKTAWAQVGEYSKENPDHETMLMSLWTTLRPNEELDNRLSKKWIDIGFQGQDPATDFRGAGLLGLKQLASMLADSRYKKKALEMYAESQKQDHWFFYAVTGINITRRLLNSLKDSKDQVYRVDIDSFILDSAHPVPADTDQMSQLMDRFYRFTFERFTERWVAAKPNIMEFNQFLDDIYGLELKK